MPSTGYNVVWEFNAGIISDAEMNAFNAAVAGKDNYPSHFAVQFDTDNPAHWLWMHNYYQHPTINQAKQLVFRLDDDDLNLHSQSQLWANDTGAGIWNQSAETGYRFSVYDHSYEFSFKMFLPRNANEWLGDTQWLNVLQLHKLESGYVGPPPIGVYIDKDKPGGEAGKAFFHLEARDENWSGDWKDTNQAWAEAAIETNKWYTHTIKYTQAEQGFLSWQLDGKTLFSSTMDLGFTGPGENAKLLLPTFGVYNHSIPGAESTSPDSRVIKFKDMWLAEKGADVPPDPGGGGGDPDPGGGGGGGGGGGPDPGSDIVGTGRADLLVGTGSGEQIFGGNGKDTLKGEGGDDQLFGDNGGDRLEGGTGDDTVNGGAGSDDLYGELGNDTFVIDTFQGVDRIHDFERGADTIQLKELKGIDSANLLQVLRDVDLGSEVVIQYDSNGSRKGGFKELVRVVDVDPNADWSIKALVDDGSIWAT